MNTQELDHVLRAIDNATGEEHRFLLIGSQAILAHLSLEYFDIDVLYKGASPLVGQTVPDKL